MTMPRSFVKTWISSIAYPIWITLRRTSPDEFPEGVNSSDKFWQLGPNMRILIASYIITNAEKMIGLIRKTYESNTAMQILFPEVIPENFKKVKWSNEAACINRDVDSTEQTFEAAGIGGGSVSRHYDLIIEDDLIYAKKDDFTNKELQPNQDAIDKAIGWHKIVTSLLVPGKHTRIHNTGTRWAKHDLVDYIWTHEPDYKIFRRACVKLTDAQLASNKGEKDFNWETVEPEWPECYDHTELMVIARAQGPYMFATQYLLLPMSPEDLLFNPSDLELYISREEVPKSIRIFTTVDLSGWTENPRKGSDCNGVVLTCGWDENNHMWILHYDVGRFSPSRVLEIMAKHWTTFHPERIGVESVYYQKALIHFAYRYMNEGKIPRMTIDQLKPENNKSKDLRILALEPYITTHAVHCKSTHREFISETSEFILNNNACKKDILDTAAYQIQIARPGEPLSIDRRTHREPKDIVCAGTVDELLRSIWDGRSNKDIFGNAGAIRDPYSETYTNFEEYANAEDMVGATPNDPFAEHLKQDFELFNN